MRIISGQARGRKLVTLEGEATRPTLDRTREALFNILQTRVRGAKVLDLFAGSGALGLEALSRGAQSAVFCDNSRQACDVIRKNIDAVRVGDRSRLLCCDAMDALKRLAGERFDLVFLDPPYRKGLVDQALRGLLAAQALEPEALVVVETAQEEAFDLPESLRIADSRKYGKSRLHFLVPA
ncbi:MAG: 16S rRNA (guanine(966)-N(2))-methyltransferase RsmD [Candidatus Spyradocola sp.]|jgi:16S rRNA (guanine966-N2)-methyltransferase